MKGWTTMMKPIQRTIQAAIKAQIALMKKTFSQQKGKIKMKEIRAKTGQEKEKCLQLLQQGFSAKEMSSKKI